MSPEGAARPEVTEQRTALKRLLVASLGMMQVMMFAVGLYADGLPGHRCRDAAFPAPRQLLRHDARRVLRRKAIFHQRLARRCRTPTRHGPAGLDCRRLGLRRVHLRDIHSRPAVWFDSVTMFVFFLTLGRFLEMRARHRSIDRGVALSSLLPNTSIRIDNGVRTTVPVSQLAAGDTVLIRAGESIPADGLLASGSTSVDEALLTGEARPQVKGVGDELSAGSVNLDNMIEMTVTTTGGDTTLGTISRLSERARYARPAFVTLADQDRQLHRRRAPARSGLRCDLLVLR